MRKAWFVVLVLWVVARVTIAAAVTFTYYPSDPLTVVDLQGRPIPGNVVSIVDTSGNPVSVWNDMGGTQAFAYVVPSTGILQFFANPGIYRVTITGLGLTRIYWVNVSGTSITSIPYIAIDRTAVMIAEVATGNPPTLVCVVNNPCQLIYNRVNGNQIVAIDFVMPTFPLSVRSLSWEWYPSTGIGTSVWNVDWCTYQEGADICAPTGANSQTVASFGQFLNKRTDLDITFTPPATMWSFDSHVVLFITHMTTDARDNVQTLSVDNLRMEFNKL